MAALALPSHQDLRCFQRAALRAYAVGSDGGWLRMWGGGRFALRYLLPAEAPGRALAAENKTHGDLIATRSPDHESACAEKLLRWFRIAPALLPAATFIGVTDEDAWLHPPRLLHDLSVAAHLPNLLYGHLSWAQGWDEKTQRHFGYTNVSSENRTRNLLILCAPASLPTRR
jgi:hypothetical protein